MSKGNWVSGIAAQWRLSTFVLIAIVALALSACAAPPATPPAAEETAAESAAVQEYMGTLPLNITSEQRIADVVGTNQPALATLSSTGAHVAWVQSAGALWNREGQLCIYTFDTGETACVNGPETYEGYPYDLAWSPDDSMIAFTENPIQLAYESDIWVYDVAAQTFTDLTDDGVTGGYSGLDAGTYALDYFPMWTADGRINFWRSEPQGDETATFALYTLDPAGGEPTLLRDLTGDFPGEFLLFNTEEYYMDGVSALAPDGSKVAMILTRLLATDPDNAVGLWVVDTSGDAPPTQLADSVAFQAAQPSWSGLPVRPLGLSWTGDSAGVVVFAGNNDPQIPVTVIYYTAADGGGLTPVVDFSDVPDSEAYTTATNELGLSMRYYAPWSAAVAPDGNTVLMYTNLGNLAGILMATMPPTGDMPAPAYRSDDTGAEIIARSSRSADGKVLLSGILFQTSAPAGDEAAGSEETGQAEAGATDLTTDETVELARADLAAQLSVSPDAIETVDVQEVTWPDASLGCPAPDMMYAQALQDGLQIQLQVGEDIYFYHSAAGQPPFWCETPAPPAE